MLSSVVESHKYALKQFNSDNRKIILDFVKEISEISLLKLTTDEGTDLIKDSLFIEEQDIILNYLIMVKVRLIMTHDIDIRDEEYSPCNAIDTLFGSSEIFSLDFYSQITSGIVKPMVVLIYLLILARKDILKGGE